MGRLGLAAARRTDGATAAFGYVGCASALKGLPVESLRIESIPMAVASIRMAHRERREVPRRYHMDWFRASSRSLSTIRGLSPCRVGRPQSDRRHQDYR